MQMAMSPQILGGLQSCSRADLITMVLSMHREMDSLREQIRCLTGVWVCLTIREGPFDWRVGSALN